MSELAAYDPPGAVAQQQDVMQSRAVARLGEWAQSAAAAYEVAKGLVGTSFVPQQFRGKPEEATAAILSGAEVGLSPMASLKSFDIISGTAAPRALTLRAIVQSQGHDMLVEESTETRCRMRGRRRGSADWVTVTWTMDRAKNLGLTSKDNWRKQPGAMLVARATGELARLIAADAILGIGYTIEELTDGGQFDAPAGETPPPPTPATRTMRRPQASESAVNVAAPSVASSAGDHGIEGEASGALSAHPQGEASPAADSDPIMLNTRGALARAMFAALGHAGVTDKDQRLAFCADVAGRTIESSGDLTEADARAVIDAAKAHAEQLADVVTGEIVDPDLAGPNFAEGDA